MELILQIHGSYLQFLQQFLYASGPLIAGGKILFSQYILGQIPGILRISQPLVAK